MINYSNTSFVISAPSKNLKPQESFPEVLIVGKSNVGKSSLINALCSKKRLAYTSSKPGHTKLLNYYNVDNKFFLVDAPGYGYANGGLDLDQLFSSMMEDYFTDNQFLHLVLILVDARREFSENDLEILNFVKDENIPYLIVVTKVDKVNQSEKSKLIKMLNSYEISKEAIFYTSALENKTLEPLRKGIEKFI